ncbi:MAG: O-antigen ligase family protein [Acidobacteria bacterium]|nr:O-antigen ligase family protein [Acidobacteriota bacterium]
MKALSGRRLRFFLREGFAPDDADRLDTLAFALLIAFAAGAPFLYGIHTATRGTGIAIGGGAVMPAGNFLLEASAFLMTAVVLLSKLRVRSLRPLAIPMSGLIALAVLGLFQVLPLGYGTLDRIAPVNAQIYHETARILTLFGSSPPPAPRISIAPSETLETILLTLAYACLFFSSASLLRTRLRRRLFLGTLLVAGVGEVALAVVREPTGARLHGVFANTNHFGGYLEIVLAIAFGALWAEVLTGRRRGDSPDRADRFEKRFLPLAAFIVLWSVIAVGIALTESRGAMLAAAAATLTLVFLAPLHQRVQRRRRIMASAALAITAGLLFTAATIGRRPFLRFLESDPREIGSDARVALWRTSVSAWREFPVFGSGLGTFREAFRRVQTREFNARVEQAHSDFLQLLVTGGAVGAFLGFLVFASVGWLLLRAWRNQKHREESAVVLAGVGALLSLTLHGLVEFNMSIPPIPATLACVVGAAWAAGRHT